MSGLLEYILSEFKGKKLSKQHAAAFLRELKGKGGGPEPIHPMLGANTSDLSRQAYTTRFHGREHFLADHRIRMGAEVHSILPGAAYLEMARAAIADALRDPGLQGRLELRDIVWSHPLIVDESTEVEIELSTSPDGSVAFRVVSRMDTDAPLVHCQGSGATLDAEAPPPVDLNALQAGIDEEAWDSSSMYEAYRRLGLLYGPSHRTVRRVLRGHTQLLAELQLPEGLHDSLSAMPLHPGMLDGAFQACIGLMEKASEIDSAPPVPFALSSARVYAPCQGRMFVAIRPVIGGAGDGDLKVDLDVVDVDGNVCIRLQGFWSRVLHADESAPGSLALLAAPSWRPMDESIVTSEPARLPLIGMIGCGIRESDLVEPSNGRPLLSAIAFEEREGLAERFQHIARSLFAWIRERQESGSDMHGLVQVIVREDEAGFAAPGIFGLMRSLEQEHPGFRAQIIRIDPSLQGSRIGQTLRDCQERPEERMIRIGQTERSVLRWNEMPSAACEALALKEGGVYLITGGLGGLGRIVAGDILRLSPHANVYLTGREELDDERRSLLASLKNELGGIAYRRMDLGSLDEVQSVLEGIRATHGGLHGIIHCAGMLRDGRFATKSLEDFLSVMEPKVAGTCHLDQASRNFDLDFFALFSSLASAYGNAGQTDYAMANGFMDGFAEHRNQLVRVGQRSGKTVSINWPYWQEGGMRMDDTRLSAIRTSTGIEPLATRTGLDLFHRCLELPHSRLQVLAGDIQALRRILDPFPESTPPVVSQPNEARSAAIQPERLSSNGAPDGTDLAERTLDFLKREISTELKVPLHQLDPHAGLDRYGINSIVAMNLTARLEKTFGPLPKTLLFERQTVDELREHFLASHREALENLFAASQSAPEVPERQVPPIRSSAPAKPRSTLASRLSNPRRPSPIAPMIAATRNEPVAIIGLSGRYPGAINIDQYWRNLRAGKDCITEIPRQRWDWRDFYSEDRSRPGFHYSKWGGFIEGVEEFDPLFFGITPWEAELMDPQERLFLQHAWMAVEDAGYSRASLQVPRPDSQPGQIGVYAGVMYGEYNPSGSVASIANRVSYTLNLHGPCMTIDTMCSSSLTAIHLACQDLKSGRTDLGIAGGVNITIHPAKYGMLSMGQFISSDGHCQSFGEGGDGYIPGEGVGIVLLKRLSDAVRDNDHIYAVLRSSAVNHGGKTNGFTVPNPQAQADVITQALRSAGVEARRISYVEAHGTGTKLGDPIEIAALTKSFQAGTREIGFCRIGSAKSNIGHCESAAGIAGLTKVLLQLRHGEIVPSLHSRRLNPDIDFTATPFVVNQALTPWERTIEDGRVLPRIAGLSSFGAGGSNAHLVIEEWLSPRPVISSGTPREVLIPLSARTRAQLRQKAADLLDFLSRGGEERPEGADLSLGDIAYTLQVGREHLSYRLGLLSGSIEQACAQLKSYLEDRPAVAGLFEGLTDESRDALALFRVDQELQAAIGRWIDSGKFSHLLELWTKGLDFDWHKLHPGTSFRRVSLPSYPFARERYWKERNSSGPAAIRAGSLHPLVHANRSDFYCQQYLSTFDGKEWVHQDHRVGIGGAQPRPIMPAVAYLEMSRAAWSDATSGSVGFRPLEIRDVVWAKPLDLETEKKVVLRLEPIEEQEAEFRILGLDDGPDAFHCQGRIETLADVETPALDLPSMRSRFAQDTLAPDALYAAFQEMGVNYGPGFRSLTALGRDGREVLADLAIPSGIAADQIEYVLHPALLDGALQAVLGTFLESGEASRTLFMPFSLESLSVFAPLGSAATAWVRPASDRGNSNAEIEKFDLDLLDSEGHVLAQLRGFCARAVSSQPPGVEPEGESLLAIPEWKPMPATSSKPEAGSESVPMVILCDLPDLAAALGEALGKSGILILSEAGEDLASRYENYAIACFRHVRTLIQEAQGRPLSIQLLVPDTEEGQLLSGIHGMLRAAALEHPSVAVRVALVDPVQRPEESAALPGRISAAPEGSLSRMRGGNLETLSWIEVVDADSAFPSPFRSQGVYLITGGLGGLGVLFAKEILGSAPDASVILTGRGERPKPGALDVLGSDAGRVRYEQADLGSPAGVEALFARILRTSSRLDGIIHSAGMIKDGLLLRKSDDEFLGVLEPKVAGTYHLDRASRDLDLDFFALFSSVAGSLGNLGQADYAAANAFMDRFSIYREELRMKGLRKGRTISINWPLWRTGGMHVDSATLAWMRRTTGLVPLDAQAGIQAFRKSLASGSPRVMVLHGDAPKLRGLLTPPVSEVRPPVAKAPGTTSSSQGSSSAEDAGVMQEFLKREFSAVLKIPVHELDPKAQFDQVGIDSILAVNLTARLEETFGPLSKTLLFEYQTLSILANHLARKFPDALNVKDTTPRRAGTPPHPVALRKAPGLPAREASGRNRFAGRRSESGDIAIIGISGRYPQADNLEEFWANLREGRDCITEIPPRRWDYRKYFNPERNRPGTSYGKWGGFLEDIEAFDPLFFHISQREAELIDPQERLFLQTVWESIEDAGYSRERFSRHRVGVYVGAMWSQYQLFGAEAMRAGLPIVTSSSHASIANRVSYFFDLRGPSLAIDTMCSSSLTAIHLACEELRKGGIEAAIAGGVNLSIHPNKYLNLSQGNFISSDGRCRSFGEGGDGYVPGEGVGAVILKPLRNALRDGDHVHGVIKAGAINHGGKTHGYTVPNPQAQGELIGDSLRAAGIDARTIDYVEAHGTGTSLGDPIEIAGLSHAFGQHTQEKGFCPIGSVKSNIGHLESAAGIAALTKVLLQLRHNELVPSLHAERENPNIDFADTAFYVQRDRVDWPRRADRPRRVGISSFGAGGANAHLVVEDFISPAPVRPLDGEAGPYLFVFSARNGDALSRCAERYRSFLDRLPSISALDLACTLQIGRTEMASRLAVVADGLEDLRSKIAQWQEWQENGFKGRAPENVFQGRLEKQGGPIGDLLEGEAGKALLHELITERNLPKIARLWTSGLAIDWAALQEGGRRIPLPTYPFAKERCWIEIPEALADAGPNPVEMGVGDGIPRLRQFTLDYQPTSSVAPAGGSIHQGPFLIIGGSGPAHEAVVADLRGRNSKQEVLSVRFGDRFAQSSPDEFTVRPGCREDFAALAGALASRGHSPLSVLLCPEDDSDEAFLTSEAGLQRGFYSLAWLCQGLLRTRYSAPVRIISCSLGREEDPMRQALTGFFRSLHQENPKYAGKCVEILAAPSGMDHSWLARTLAAEMQDLDRSTDAIRYTATEGKGFLRNVHRLKEIDAAASSAALPLRQGGVYLISGGLGGLGFHISGHLLQSTGSRLMVFGRSSLAGAAERRFSELRARSEHVHYMQADVTRLEDMREVVREAKRRFGRIDGVVHAAGINRDSFLLAKEPEDMAQVIGPKVLGAINLDEATREEQLDIFVLFSSVAGILGNAGQCDYAFGNRYLDAFASQREARRVEGRRCGKTYAIHWPYWQDGGMSLPPQEIQRNEKTAGIVPLPTDQGIECWERILCGDHGRVMPLYGLSERMDAALLRPASIASEAPAPAMSDTDGEATMERTVDYLRTIIADQTKIAADRLDPRERFDAFGIDSVMVGGINAILERDLGPLPKTLFYEYSTIEELAEYLVQDAAAALAKRFGKGAAAPESIVPVAPAPPPRALPQPAATTQEQATGEAIAIIGIDIRLPQANGLEQFWTNLKAGRDAVGEIPEDRWDYRELFDPDPAKAVDGKIYCKWGAFLDDVGGFDAEFFGISEQEACVIDPQERLALQSVWSALEDAGYTRDALRKIHPKGKSAAVGVFYGVTTNSYQLLGPDQWNSGNAMYPNSMPWSIANRISYFFDFQGPSLPVDSACSSTSVAIHLACESLRRGESRLAVAGGVNLYLHPSKYQSFCQRGMISRTGKTCSFGAGDEGFVPGEAVGSLILKPLAQAISDGNRIYAVIRGSAFDHAGRSNGYSAPNPRSQAELIERTLDGAGVAAETISYVEGHGTGTQLGDSAEIAALNRAFKRRTDKEGFCAVGSVKANVGHAESAAGIAAMAKVLLQLRHRKLAPSLHSQEVNPNLDLDRSPFYLQHGLSEWKAPASRPRRALINSFGAGGVNACLIVEEFLPRVTDTEEDSSPPHLFVLSARSPDILEEYAGRMIHHIASHLTESPACIAYTSQVGREPMSHRLAVVFRENKELIRALRDWRKGGKPEGIHAGVVSGAVPRDPVAVEAALRSRDLDFVATAWTCGAEIPWEALHSGQQPRKTSLPTYPFASKTYWVPAPGRNIRGRGEAIDAGARLHPLVAYNSSTLNEIKVTSILSDREFYAREHAIAGNRVFPGSGFAELACVSGSIAGGQKVLAIEDLVWMQPLAFADGGMRRVETHLRTSGNGAAFQIVSYDEEQEKVTHCEGRLRFAASDSVVPAGVIIAMDSLKGNARSIVEGSRLYRDFERAGLGYGPSFRTVQEIHRGDQFVLSRLEIPDSLLAGFYDYILHPSILDGAFQAVAGFQDLSAEATAYMPFAIDAIEILAPMAPICYALVEPVAPQERADSPVKKFHITIMGEGGNAFVRIRNFYARALEAIAAR